MKSLKWPLFNLHFWSCFLDLSISILVQPFICSSAVYLAGFSIGLLHNLGVSNEAICYIGVFLINGRPRIKNNHTENVEAVAVAIVSIFENRYFLIAARRTWWRYARIPVLTANYIVALIYFIPTLMNVPEQTIARKMTFEVKEQGRNKQIYFLDVS
uniref:Serpentine receptor class gamma n=1 Tax=Caenorhabditis tropicalis TaxID=1561998 RepID=A0A1I7UWJ6_9PELO